ncbi:MAG: hypothetical protein BYD32DRAFT_457973 [Podila humilis]|nr:MAG: hypothetical protein BYD32DRAFT_457973 [Podila humilis]
MLTWAYKSQGPVTSKELELIWDPEAYSYLKQHNDSTKQHEIVRLKKIPECDMQRAFAFAAQKSESNTTLPPTESAPSSNSSRKRTPQAYDDAVRAFQDTPLLLFAYFNNVFKLAYSVTPNPILNEDSTQSGSDNQKVIVQYCRHLLQKTVVTEIDLKHVYSVSHCLDEFGGQGSDNFHASKYDLTWLHQEVQLLLAELVRHERAEPPDTRENAAGRDRTAERKNKQKALAIILYLATLLNSGDFERKRSEDTCVFVWKYVRTTLIGKGSRVVFDVDELASEATKADIHKTELLFGTLTQVNERKPHHATKLMLEKQTSKVIRINRSILARLQSKDTIVFLDVHSLTASILGIRAHEDVYGCVSLGEIVLPTSDLAMEDFLGGKSFGLLFWLKTPVERFTEDYLKERIRNRASGPSSQPENPEMTPAVHTPARGCSIDD